MCPKFTLMEYLHPTSNEERRNRAEEVVVRLVQLLARRAARSHMSNLQGEQTTESTTDDTPTIREEAHG